MTVRRMDAMVGPYPNPIDRKGTPHNRLKMVPGDWVTKCDQNPSRVPGRERFSRNWARTVEGAPGRTTDRVAGGTPLRTTSSTPISATSDTADAERNAVVHPWLCSSIDNGIADRTCPSAPTVPRSWDANGRVRPENQLESSRRTEINVIASPAPTRMRPRIAIPILGATARVACPATISPAPRRMRNRGPTRSSTIPMGICRPAYTMSCTTASVDSTAAEISNRSVASTPATPRELRCSTAMTYAKVATPNISQDRLEFTVEVYPPCRRARQCGASWFDTHKKITESWSRRRGGWRGSSRAPRRWRRRSAAHHLHR